MTTVEDVLTEAVARLRANTPFTWYEWFVPDSETLPDGTWGVVSVLGPFEPSAGSRERGIIGVEHDPMVGTLLVEITADSPEAVKAQSATVLGLLRGWAPTNTGVLRSSAARGYQPVTSKFRPTLVSRNMLFRFTTNLEGSGT